MKILVVDDSKVNHYFLSKLLQGWGEIQIALDGLEGLEKAADHLPDLIISDILMPRMDGFQLCRELKANPQLRHIPVVFYSADYIDNKDRDFALSLGAADYLIKSEDLNAFVMNLQQVLQNVDRLKTPGSPAAAPVEEETYLKVYSERLHEKLVQTIGKLERAIADLEESNKDLTALLQVSNAVSGTQNLGDVLYAVNESVVQSMQVTSCAILLLNVGEDELNIVGEYGNLIEQLLDIFIRVDENTVVARALREKRHLAVFDVKADQEYKPMFAGTDIKSLLAVPLWSRDQVIGIMLITESRQNRTFSDKEIARAQAIANQAALTIQNALLIQEIREKNVQLLESNEKLEQRVKVRTRELEVQFKKVEQGKQEWESTFDAITDRIVILSPDQRIIRANRATADMLQCGYEQVLGRSCCMADAEGQPLPSCPVTCSLASGAPAFTEMVDQAGRTHHLWSYPVFNRQGKLISLVEVGKDVTEAKQAEAEIRRANEELHKLNAELTESHRRLQELDRLKDDFIAVLSHELRTPLTAIIGFNEMMREGLEGELAPVYQEYSEIVAQRADELLGMINTVLEFSQLTAGKVSFHPSLQDISGLLVKSMDKARATARDKDITLQIKCQKNLPAAEVDTRALRQVVDALLSNALKFTPKGGVVTVDAGCDHEGLLRVAISDTGIGINPEHFDLIFDRFRQLERHETRHYGGLGLGLAIAKQFIEFHHGRIWVESQVGKGSTFVFTLPFPASTEVEAPPPSTVSLF